MNLRIPKPTPTPSTLDAEQVSSEAMAGPDDPTQAACDFVKAQQAVGTSWGSAFAAAVGVFGGKAVKPAWAEFMDGNPTTLGIRQALDEIAPVDLGVAHAWLHDALRAGKVREPSITRGAQGKLSVSNTSWFIELPTGLDLSDCDLDVDFCGALVHLPQDHFKVGGNLWAQECVNLLDLPIGLEVGEDLWLEGCDALVGLPDDLIVHGDLILRSCSSLADVPAGVRVDGKVDLTDCPSLRSLPKGLEFSMDALLDGCTLLQSLPHALKVGGCLSLKGCFNLATLPDGLDVGASLNLARCSSWDGRIPADARVGGRITTDAHPHPGITLDVWRSLHPQGEYA